MNMKKLYFNKIASVIMAIVIILATMPVCFATDYSGTCNENSSVDNVTWSFNETTGEMVISGTGAMKHWSSTMYLPWKDLLLSIKTITVEEGISVIGSNSFYGCENLTEVTLPEGLLVVGKYAFRECLNIKEISLPDSMHTIGEGAFYGCLSLKEVTIPQGVTYLHMEAFRNCLGLKSVRLHSDMRFVKANVFEGCMTLSDVYYDGTEAEWNDLKWAIDDVGNTLFLNAKIHYNSKLNGTNEEKQDEVSDNEENRDDEISNNNTNKDTEKQTSRKNTKDKGGSGIVVVIAIIAVGVGVAFVILKKKK